MEAVTTSDNHDDDDTISRLRDLNDYESMLATSTCNVGMHLSWCIQQQQQQHDDNDDTTTVDYLLREAWTRTVAQRKLLQVRLVPKQGVNGMGLLGQRYSLLPSPVKADDERNPLFVIHHEDKKESSSASSLFSCDSLVRELQKVGTTALDIDKGSYYVSCRVQELPEQKGDSSSSHSTSGTTTTINVQLILSICHALSDGPGALQVARSFLEHLSNVLATEQPGNMTNPQHQQSQQEAQPLADLQALLLGSDHGAQQPANPHAFEGQDDFVKHLSDRDKNNSKTTIALPPEAMQGIPSDGNSSTPQPNVIDCVHFSLSAEETNALRTACRKHETTVQGALTAAALHTRMTLLGLDDKKQDGQEKMLHAAVQIPVNMRRFASDENNAVIRDEDCLCGSAGVWHTVKLVLHDKNDNNSNDHHLWLLAKHSTDSIRAALEGNNAEQPREWLRRLFHDPATLPPYSLMVSSLGVAPIEESYGKQQQQQSCCLKVSRVLFFGGALTRKSNNVPPTSQPPQQSTMIHAMTFGGEFNGMFNYTSPGVSKDFAIKTVKLLKATLLSMATTTEYCYRF